jgi:hypothetical protein
MDCKSFVRGNTRSCKCLWTAGGVECKVVHSSSVYIQTSGHGDYPTPAPGFLKSESESENCSSVNMKPVKK